MDQYMSCMRVYLDKIPEIGFGVFAREDIKKGDCVERGIMIPLVNCDGNENPHFFTWSDDRKTWAMGSGYLPFYNHSDTPNIQKAGNLKNNTMEVIALRDITKGEELRGTYYSKKWRKCFQDF